MHGDDDEFRRTNDEAPSSVFKFSTQLDEHRQHTTNSTTGMSADVAATEKRRTMHDLFGW